MEACADGEAVVGMTVDARHINAGGAVQGGAIFTLADFAFAVATNSGGVWTVSLSNSISFLKTVRGGRLTARAKRISQSNRTCCYEVTVTDGAGDPIAQMMATGFCREKPLKAMQEQQ
ncbi:MAG: PaaI family thioesterase [Oscillospiraceae bacterium]